jgi:CBS domain-containing protein
MRVRDFMVEDPLTVAPDTEIRRVVRLLIEHDISGAPVVDDTGTVVGVITERDCIAVAAEAGYYAEWGGAVSRYMSAPVEVVGPDESLVDIAGRMASSPYRRFPVIEDGRLVGLLSRRDVLRAIDVR